MRSPTSAPSSMHWACRHELLSRRGLCPRGENRLRRAHRRARRRRIWSSRPRLPGRPTTAPGSTRACACCGRATSSTSKAWGAYVQDLVQVAPPGSCWAGCATTILTAATTTFCHPGQRARPRHHHLLPAKNLRLEPAFRRPVPAHGAQFVPLLVRNSFNTSGDTYSYNAQSANTPPEQSENIELGAKIDSADKRFSTRSPSSAPPRKTSATPTRTPPPRACCFPASATPRASRSTWSAS